MEALLLALEAELPEKPSRDVILAVAADDAQQHGLTPTEVLHLWWQSIWREKIKQRRRARARKQTLFRRDTSR